MQKIACFDVGGTFIKYATIDEAGNILYKSKKATPRSNCRVKIPELIAELVEEMSKDYSLNAIGICTAGNVDPNNGEIIFASDNIPEYTGAKLSEYLIKRTGLPCKVENDVNAAAIGESWIGAGRNVSSFICITLGTGIGGAIINDNKLINGSFNGAGEIGHMVISEDGIPCGCGGRGCYEQYASANALVAAYEAEAGIDKGTADGRIVFEKIRTKDEAALKVYEGFIKHVVTGLINITHLLDPGLIVIGGGISESGDDFFEALNKDLKKRLIPAYQNHTSIVKASLGNDAGLIGACKIAL